MFLLILGASCLDPGLGVNAKKRTNITSVFVYESLTYDCILGTETADDVSVICKYDGEVYSISNSPPNCTGM